ncbi:MAG: HAD family hydrolase [Candidatus Magasanikbacteria bacterium]|nr:HAD family hydrolase [Candidatus Magasanikbacteria bacterium]
MFIIDFDDTLFNTRPGFSNARVAALAPLGISEDLYLQTYREARNSASGQVWYDDQRHAQVLAMKGFDEDKAFAALASTMAPERLKEFLFPDAITFLEKLKSFGEPMILLSLGDAEYQFKKVRALEIEKYFDRVFMVDEEKHTVMEELLKNVSDKEIWFINDKVPETVALAKQFPEIKIVMKKSSSFPEAEYQATGLPYFNTLTEIYDHISSHR